MEDKEYKEQRQEGKNWVEKMYLPKGGLEENLLGEPKEKGKRKSRNDLEREERNDWLAEKRYNQDHGSSWGVWCPKGPD